MDTSSLNEKLKNAVVAAAAERAVPVRIALWPNGNRREGKNDAQFTGRVTISVLALGEMIAKAIADGRPEIELFADVWHNEPSTSSTGGERPTLSGKARNEVTPRGPAQESVPGEDNAVTMGQVG